MLKITQASMKPSSHQDFGAVNTLMVSTPLAIISACAGLEARSGRNKNMVKVEIIEKAIAAHAQWKARLRTAAGSGKFDIPTDKVRADNQCEFGKWLYGSELTAAEKQTHHYLDVKQLHAQFHREAAKVVDLANSGQKAEVEKAISMGGNYAKSSSALTSAMISWRESLH
jgi:hypothetical protein